jgi:hypothetical protein
MTTPRTRIVSTLIALVLAAAFGAQLASAQGIGVNWHRTTNLSNTPTSSNRPAVAADPAGNVHVVWGEDIGGESIVGIPQQLIVDASTLVYTRWDGSTWSDPIDIIWVPGDDLAEYASLAADSSGYLHLVWTGMTRIYYSRALASQAGSAHAWSTPLDVGSSARTSWESAVAVDVQGTVHILYADRETNPAVMHVRIADNGLGSMTWTSLSAPLARPDEAAFLNVSLKIDPKGRLHALWGAVRAEGFGHAVYYARSVDAGQTWSEPVRLAQGEKGKSFADMPSLGVAGDSELHLIYCYPANMGRTERISLDAGETWGEPHAIYKDLEGISGFHVQLTDAAGNLHVVSHMRTHDQVGGLYYWRWMGDHWSPGQVASLGTPTVGPGGHFDVATMRLGNEIHAVWNSNFCTLAGEVWHVSGVIPDVAAQAPIPLPTVEAAPSRSSSGAQAVQAQPTTVVSGHNVSGGMNAMPNKEPTPAPGMASTLLVGLAPALVLVLGVVAWRLARKR